LGCRTIEDDRPRTPKNDPVKTGNGGVRAPVKGESSTSGQLPSDAPTLFDLPQNNTFKKEPDRTYAGSGMSAGGPRSYSEASGQPLLELGSVVGRRYEVIALLGEGGMGAVYEAKDLELNRTIALKTIRREFGGNQSIIERFKQELILSTQVTHRNVVRIFDLGEAEGMKFITMEYVQGIDLRTMIHERGKIPPDETVEIIIQVCRALDAAHSVGVIHRDLKPQNIMQDQNGRILVMDFGLARTLEGDGMTMSGALVGTMEYMSPEQALSKSLDQRSDIYSLGLIFYELLSGEVPFRADTALASLIRRTQEKPVPVSQHVSDISGSLDMIVSRCLEREVELRYSSAAELLADLETWQQKGVVSAPPIQVVPKKKALPAKRWQMWGGLAAALVVGAGTYIDLSWKSAKPGAKAPVAAVEGRALAIMPFRNASGDAKDDWIGASLADMLSTDIGQSAHLRTVSTDRLHQVLSDLNIGPQTTIGPETVRRVAEFSNADVVVSGQYARFGDQIVIDATIRDMKRDQSVAVKAQALAKDLPVAIDSLADEVRKNLSLSPDVLQELKSQSFKPNSGSVDALRNYNEGLALMREGKNLDALKSFQAATKLDTQFALAFSRLAEVQSELGFVGDAEGSSRRAVELASSEDLPLPEKYLITAGHARIINDNKQAIDAYQNLAKSWPSDVDVQYNLGTLYINAADYAKARDVFAKILESDPKNIKALWEMGVVENMLGNPQAALDSLSKGLNLATQVGNQEQQALILLSTGISYRHLNRPDEAMRNVEQSIAINEKIGQKRGVAAALAERANLQARKGDTDASLADFNKALTLLREIGMKKEAGDALGDMGTVYQDRGDYDKALEKYKESLQIQRETGDQNYEAICLINIAAVYLAKGDTDNAFTYYQQALQLREKLGVPAGIAETLAGVADVYIQTGQYDTALTSLMRALELSRKAGDARQTAILSHQVGQVLGYQGRFGAAVKSMQESTKVFQDRGEHGQEMASMLNDLAGALASAGRGNEAAQPLNETENIVRELKNDALMAEVLNTKGDVAYYSGDIKDAEQFYKSALSLAARAKDNDTLALSKLNVAKMAIAQGRAKDALGMLRQPANSTRSTNAYLSLQSAIANAQVQIESGDYLKAEHALEQSLIQSEKAGTRLESAKINYLLGTSARLRGNAEKGRSSYYYGEALRLLAEIKSDPGAENALHRADLKAIYDDAMRWKT
jgi:eukaryotic-like serine/threonine-protein kinase